MSLKTGVLRFQCLVFYSEYYGILKTFPYKNLLGRTNEVDKKRTLYFVSDAVKEFLICNQDKVGDRPLSAMQKVTLRMSVPISSVVISVISQWCTV